VFGVLEQDSGKLLVYASGFSSREKRFSCVSVAAERMARLLKISFEVVTLGEEATPIYVYYKNGQEEPIPIYCDKGEEVTMKEVYAVLRRMMYVLSFHPRHSTLKAMRNEIIQLS
jgi:hypothetical protein